MRLNSVSPSDQSDRFFACVMSGDYYDYEDDDDDYEHCIDDFDDNCDDKSHVMFGYHENCDFDDICDFDLSSLLKRIQNTGTKR